VVAWLTFVRRVPGAFGTRDGGIERGNIQPDWHRGVPLDGPRLHIEVPIGIGERPPEVVEYVSEIRASLRLGGVGPEAEGDVLARLWGVLVEDEVGQERFGASRPKARQGSVAAPQLEAAEESDGQGC
jgi:hypothetical protein